MSFRINTNLDAISAHRNLMSTGSMLSSSINKLSTGLRINSAADDPAGLIASENFRAQISGMDAALRNNQDALNYAKTADGALDEVSRLLRDARALAVANASSTVDATQKQANQTQLDNIMASITRISGSTSFGTKKLLNGASGATATVTDRTNFAAAYVSGTMNSVAMNQNGVLNVQVTTTAEQAIVTGTATYATGATLVGAGTFSINGVQFTTNAQTTRDQLVSMINAKSSETGAQASVNGSNAIVLNSFEYGTNTNINLVSATAGLILSAAGSLSDAGANAVATVTYSDGSTLATATFDQGQGLQLKDSSGNVIKLTTGGNRATTFNNGVQIMAGASAFQIGANADQSANLNLTNISASSLGLGTINILGTDMSSALDSLDDAIETVSTLRANVGSFMRNTIESNIRSLSITKESLVATESSIRDVDIAQEMTQYTKYQILQQSGLSILAQANSAPQSVLSLLRG